MRLQGSLNRKQDLKFRLSAAADLSEPFKALDEAYKRTRRFILAYSGGKDSTATAIVLYKWALNRRPRDLEVIVLHGDTLSEIPAMETWARGFMEEYAAKLSELGVNVITEVATPDPTDTFYWRVFVRGYPAPTFAFRWCVYLLKLEPTRERLSRYHDYILVVGSRDEESVTRAKSMRVRFGTCMVQGSCLGAYLTADNDIPKVAPIRFWSTGDVWAFLSAQEHFNVKPLIDLYLDGSLGVRYGCWHCTLAKAQWGLYLNDKYLYAEALRLLYRAVSDTPSLRTPKEGGYSKLGPLNAKGRAIIFRAIPLVEEMAGERFFYGLDEAKLGEYTLRDLFYRLPEDQADALIKEYDSTDRRVPIGLLRSGESIDGETVNMIVRKVEDIVGNNPFKKELLSITGSLMSKICDC